MKFGVQVPAMGECCWHKQCPTLYPHVIGPISSRHHHRVRVQYATTSSKCLTVSGRMADPMVTETLEECDLKDSVWPVHFNPWHPVSFPGSSRHLFHQMLGFEDKLPKFGLAFEDVTSESPISPDIANSLLGYAFEPVEHLHDKFKANNLPAADDLR